MKDIDHREMLETLWMLDPHPMIPPIISDEALTRDELFEAMELLESFPQCVGNVPDVAMALLKVIILRRDGSSRVVLNTLRHSIGAAR